MFIWPDGTVTGSIRWGELEKVVAARSDETVTRAGWDNLAALLRERRGESAPEPARTESADEEPAEADEGSAPAKNDNKAAWVDYAISQGVERDEAEGLTKADLVEMFGSDKEE